MTAQELLYFAKENTTSENPFIAEYEKYSEVVERQISYYARRYGISVWQLEGVAYRYFFQAVEKFDVLRGATFQTYLISYLRKLNNIAKIRKFKTADAEFVALVFSVYDGEIDLIDLKVSIEQALSPDAKRVVKDILKGIFYNPPTTGRREVLQEVNLNECIRGQKIMQMLYLSKFKTGGEVIIMMGTVFEYKGIKFYDVVSAAHITGVSAQWVKSWCRRLELGKIGTSYLITEEVLDILKSRKGKRGLPLTDEIKEKIKLFPKWVHVDDKE